MAESVETQAPINKRRNRSSNSSTNDSPDTKKLRSSQNYCEQHHVEEDGEPPLATPNIMPSKDIQKTLHEILKKLGKLDIMESSVYKLQATLLDLETRTKTLEGFQHKGSKDINKLQESLSFTEQKCKTNRANVDKKQENISLKIVSSHCFCVSLFLLTATSVLFKTPFYSTSVFAEADFGRGREGPLFSLVFPKCFTILLWKSFYKMVFNSI